MQIHSVHLINRNESLRLIWVRELSEVNKVTDGALLNKGLCLDIVQGYET